MYNPFHPPPAPPAFGQNKVIPTERASLLSKLVFYWLGPFLNVGYSRPLEKEDFWELPTSQLTATVTAEVESNFYARCPPEKRPKSYSSRSTATSALLEQSASARTTEDNEKQSGPSIPTLGMRDSKRPWIPRRPQTFEASSNGKKYYSSLFKALHKTFFMRWWIAGLLKLIADTLKTTTPLINKVILTWLTEAYFYHKLSDAEKITGAIQKPRGIGYGVGLAFGLFLMQEVSSLMTNHSMMMSMTIGLSIRTALIGAIFRKSLRLSGRARLEHNVGQITTMISTDVARLDRSSAFAHNAWVGPIQICIGIGLLISNLGYSALVGVGVLIFGIPLQFIFVRIIFTQRKKGVQITDRRSRITNEVLQGIRLIKFYAWEAFYIQQIGNLRAQEIQAIKKSAIARSALVAMVTTIPLLASILSFITYALTGHDLNVAIIFSSLQYFNIIRMPLVMVPIVITNLADGAVALNRISKFLTGEELAEPFTIDNEQDIAVDVDGSFMWEDSAKATTKVNNEGKNNAQSAERGRVKKATESLLPTTTVNVKSGDLADAERFDEKPFALENMKLKIPKGLLVAIVGRVGSGKSSLLQALIGEMRKTEGNVIFGGTIAYVPQTAWIRNATLRENILFGQDDDEEKFRKIVRACELEHDLQMLPHGEATEIGEKGINLSGGQKARVSLARAAYSLSDIVLLDDPLSAVDAYVGKAILENCILNGPFADRTRILVTHALHVLDKTDYIYVMDNGIIIEEGTYSHLMKDSIIFSRLVDDYGNLEHEKQMSGSKQLIRDALGNQEDLGNKSGAVLMQTEERNTGAVTWDIYSKYLGFAGGLLWVPIIILLLVIAQATQVGNNLFLGFWTGGSISGFHQQDYIGVYASLGVASAIFSFMLSLAFALASLAASLNMFKAALVGVLYSPVSFYDTTPIGRIISRLSKDQDTLDTELSMTLYQFLATFSSIIGTAALVFYTFPYLGIIFAPLSMLYWLFALYYRRTSVETKRLDSLMRSALYGSYSETLTGLSTIRAYREQDRAVRNADYGLDLENRCYFLTIAIQRWLGIRLDLIGNILILGIALFAAAFRNTVNPSKIGVVLSYTLSITQVLSEMVSQFAQNEQNMNAVERVLVYTNLPSEGDTHTPNDPPVCWPENGKIIFTDVELKYREGLPLVLKGVSFEIKPGEKVGIVGRTGSGKSSLIQALFRIVELQGGSIEIDGRNIQEIGLNVLRGQIALVPQDSTLFLGSLRDNLDPQGTHTDAELISALQRAWLLPSDGSIDVTMEAKFSLDSMVSDEGSNFSAGEKQLLALCRALVRNSQIIVLDEATSSVDVETDAKLQKTIQAEFASSTLLCIAHRLNTIVSYDRVLVMEDGRMVEFDTVLNLFDQENSIFHSLCNEAALSREDILHIRQESFL